MRRSDALQQISLHGLDLKRLRPLFGPSTLLGVVIPSNHIFGGGVDIKAAATLGELPTTRHVEDLGHLLLL